MKNLATLIAILYYTIALSQNKATYISLNVGVDIRNITIGSKPTNNTSQLDILLQGCLVSKNVEVTGSYEHFEAIKFSKWAMSVGYQFPLYGRIKNTTIKTVIIPSLEPTIINRWGDQWQGRSSHLSVAANLSAQWDINDKISIRSTLNALPRVDLYAKYPTIHSTIPIVCSTYISVVYKIKTY